MQGLSVRFGIKGYIMGLYRDNGKENGNEHLASRVSGSGFSG